jgi:hypothetical protein
MRKTDAPGNVSNRFADYDPITNPDGTVIEADWLNDVQDELIAVQEELSIAEAAGTNNYILAALKGIAKKLSKEVGEIFHLNHVKSPAAFDKDDPDSFFPGLCLSSIDGYTDISSSNWPDLVTNLRTRALTYNEGKAGAKSALDITAWAVSSSVATLTFADTDTENAILAALTEDNLVHGSFSNWRSITLGSAIGNITAGEYAITDIDPVTRTVTFAAAVSDGSGSVTAVASFYSNRIPGSTTTARVYEDIGRAIMSAGDEDGEFIAGLRRRDQIQGHGHEIYLRNSLINWPGGSASGINNAEPNIIGDPDYIGDPVTDDTNGTPRIGDKTFGPATSSHRYIWGGTYVA